MESQGRETVSPPHLNAAGDLQTLKQAPHFYLAGLTYQSVSK